MTNYKEALVSHYKDLEKATKTGFREIDAVGGFPKSKLIVVTGRPSCGKTSFALSVAYKAIKDGKKFISKRELLAKDKLFQLADMVIKVDNAPTDILEFGGGDPYGKGVIEIVKSRHTREFNFLCDYDRLTGRFTDSKNA